MSLEEKKRVKELVLVLVTSTPVTAARKHVAENAETGETSKNGENGENDEDGENSKNEGKGEYLGTTLA